MTSAGRLTARPRHDVRLTARRGLHPLGLSTQRDALLYVPRDYTPTKPAPLAVMLHGAGSCAERALRPFIPHAESLGLILLAPPSRGSTWDVILDRFGADVAFIDRALGDVFSSYAVDPTRIALEGFSDGASYALSLGLTNGDVFTHVIAFSPGFMAPGDPEGRPSIFISHGVEDRVLPIDRTSRRLVPVLEKSDYDVTYEEFAGGHTLGGDMPAKALAWWLNRKVGRGDERQNAGRGPC